MTQHVLGLKNLDLIIRDSLKNRSLVLITLGGDLTKTSDAPFINRGINRQRENDANAIMQQPVLVTANEIQSRTGFRFIDDKSQGILSLLSLSLLSLLIRDRGRHIDLLATKQHIYNPFNRG